MSDITIKIATLAGEREVTVPEGVSLDDALALANANASDLSAAVNGDATVEGADVHLSDGDVVSLAPANVKLG